ncbi:hypothetical protein DFH09DRAFT_1339764 [Mycena vulgaris]|nr:hypothetical protein DFH09DRAFT_1339764 [Mycena vulgaris]
MFETSYKRWVFLDSSFAALNRSLVLYTAPVATPTVNATSAQRLRSGRVSSLFLDLFILAKIKRTGGPRSKLIAKDAQGHYFDPFHHLRDAQFENMLLFLLNDAQFNVVRSQTPDALVALLIAPTPALQAYYEVFVGREDAQHPDAALLLYNIRRFYRLLAENEQKVYKHLLPRFVPDFQSVRLPLDYKMPPPEHFMVPEAPPEDPPPAASSPTPGPSVLKRAKLASTPTAPKTHAKAATKTKTPGLAICYRPRPEVQTTEVCPGAARTSKVQAEHVCARDQNEAKGEARAASADPYIPSAALALAFFRPYRLAIDLPAYDPATSSEGAFATSRPPPVGSVIKAARQVEVLVSHASSLTKPSKASTSAPSVSTSNSLKRKRSDAKEPEPRATPAPALRRSTRAKGSVAPITSIETRSSLPKEQAEMGRIDEVKASTSKPKAKSRSRRKPANQNPPKTRKLTDWRCDPRAITQFMLQRGPVHPVTNEPAPEGEPWYPRESRSSDRAAKSIYYNGYPEEAPIHAQRGKIPPPYAVVPILAPIPEKEITTVVTRLLKNPGYSCVECITCLHLCEFRGYGVQCTTCESQKRKGCSFRRNVRELDQVLAELTPLFQIGRDHTWSIFVHFHGHAKRVVEVIGAKAFNERFTPLNNGETMLEFINQLCDGFNDANAEHGRIGPAIDEPDNLGDDIPPPSLLQIDQQVEGDEEEQANHSRSSSVSKPVLHSAKGKGKEKAVGEGEESAQGSAHEDSDVDDRPMFVLNLEHDSDSDELWEFAVAENGIRKTRCGVR